MSTLALLMVLGAAVAHALWNIAAKSSSGDTTVFVWMYYSAGAVLCLPVGLTLLIMRGDSYVWWPAGWGRC